MVFPNLKVKGKGKNEFPTHRDIGGGHQSCSRNTWCQGVKENKKIISEAHKQFEKVM